MVDNLCNHHANSFLLDAKLIKIRRWLRAPDPSPNYHAAIRKRQVDTGLWFLDSEQYAKWKADDTSSVLWLRGLPGGGKTVLCSTVIQDVLQYCGDDPGKEVAYFFFDFNDVQKQDPEGMVRSLICQFSYQCLKRPGGLDTLFSSCEDGQQPALNALLDVTQQMVQDFPHTYIILDALDECVDRAGLLSILERMTRWQLLNLHIFVTSRPEQDIETSLERFVDRQNMICLTTESVDQDIQEYVRQRLSDDKSLVKWHRYSDIRQEIETVLAKRACGMYFSSSCLFEELSADGGYRRFRWAVCQLDALGKCRNRLMLRKSLATLPPTLDETYDRILCAIHIDDSEYAVRILRWLAFSLRPLSVEELSEAIAVDVGRDPAFDRQEVFEDPQDILNICSGLVTIATTETSSRRTSCGPLSIMERSFNLQILVFATH